MVLKIPPVTLDHGLHCNPDINTVTIEKRTDNHTNLMNNVRSE